MRDNSWFQGVVLAVALAVVAGWASAQAYLEQYPDTPDPFMGDWAGEWSEEETVDPDLFAQVIPLGQERYRIVLLPGLHLRWKPIFSVEVTAEDGALQFDEGNHHGELRGHTFTGGRHSDGATFRMIRHPLVSPTLGAAPPEGAVVLFDGENLDAWQDPEGWEILPGGIMMVSPDGEDLRTKEYFEDVRLHVEFRTPYLPYARGQSRGNSGVFLQDTYEVQILDSYGLEGYNTQGGALYKVSPPLVVACAPPLTWQTYDIEYRAPRFDEDGELLEYPRMTVHQNGILIHNDVEMRWLTAWRKRNRFDAPPSEPYPIRLQSHNNYVQFRNVWAVVPE